MARDHICVSRPGEGRCFVCAAQLDSPYARPRPRQSLIERLRSQDPRADDIPADEAYLDDGGPVRDAHGALAGARLARHVRDDA